MTEEVVEDTVSTKKINNQPNSLKDIGLGICLFVGMNLILLLAGHILGNLFWRIDSRFFGGSIYYLKIFNGVKFAAIFFINITIFIYLIVKRPRMVIGVVAGIPVLTLVLLLLWLALCLFVVVAWFTLLFLNGIGLI